MPHDQRTNLLFSFLNFSMEFDCDATHNCIMVIVQFNLLGFILILLFVDLIRRFIAIHRSLPFFFYPIFIVILPLGSPHNWAQKRIGQTNKFVFYSSANFDLISHSFHSYWTLPVHLHRSLSSTAVNF